MNTDFPTDPREALEVSLTALLLGELPGDQAVFLRDAIARDPELAQRYERLKQTLDLVRITASTPAETITNPAPALKLSQQRREELLQHFKTVAPPEFKDRRRSINPWLVPLSAAALLIAVCAGLWLPALSRSKSRGTSSTWHAEQRDMLQNTRGILPRAGKAPATPSARRLAEPAQQTEIAGRQTQIVLPPDTDGLAEASRTLAQLQKPERHAVNFTAQTVDSSSTKDQRASDLAWNSSSGGGGGLGGGLAGTQPANAPEDVPMAAFRKRYGLSTGEQVQPDGLFLNNSEISMLVDPTTGLPVQAGKPITAAGPDLSKTESVTVISVDPVTGLPLQAANLPTGESLSAYSAGPALTGIAPAPAAGSNASWQQSATLRGYYESLGASTNVFALQQDVEKSKQTAALPSVAATDSSQVVTIQGIAEIPPTMLADLGRREQLSDDVLRKKALAKTPQSKSGTQMLVQSLQQPAVEQDQKFKYATQEDAAKTKESRLAQLQLDAVSSYDRDAGIPKAASVAPVPQPEVPTQQNAFSTFSLNVSDVAFKLASASLEKGAMPDPAGVRVEEFINAFDYRDPEPGPGVPIGFTWDRSQYPFAQNRDLLRFSIKTAAQGRQANRPLNLVLLLDNSGSMERADRVRIIQEALRVLAAQLQPQDTFSVVTFARTARLWVDGIPGNQAGKVAEELSGLTPQGGTNLEEAMNLAYQTALRHYLANGVNRVVLLTDGAANLGNVDPEALKQKVDNQHKQGIALDCFGIGWEGYNDDLLETLTRNGNGRYGFINTPEEAASGFADQLAGALHAAATDVKVQVEFNPNRVTAYRQLGYAKHQLTKEQFRDNTVAAAEIAAAESGNALYVVEINPAGEGPIATVRVRYKVPSTGEVQEHEWPVPYTGKAGSLQQAAPTLRLAATASAFAEWLSASPYAAEVSPDALLGYLNGIPEMYGADTRPKTLEWMIRQAKSITGK